MVAGVLLELEADCKDTTQDQGLMHLTYTMQRFYWLAQAMPFSMLFFRSGMTWECGEWVKCGQRHCIGEEAKGGKRNRIERVSETR